MKKLLHKVRGALGRPAHAAPGDPSRPDVLLAGHSHAFALWRGFHSDTFPFHLRFFDMLAPAVAEAIAARSDGVVSEFVEFVEASPGAPVLLSFGGNEHNLLSLVENPVPFDFWHPGGAPVDPARTLVPASAMRAYFAPYLKRLGALMAGFRARFPERAAWLVLPPPPLPDNGHIARHPVVFADKIAASGVAPYGVRHKVWLLQCELMRADAAKAGLEVLEVPASVLDADGRLVPDAWGVDAVHGSVWYGQQVLHSVEGIAAAAAGGAA